MKLDPKKLMEALVITVVHRVTATELDVLAVMYAPGYAVSVAFTGKVYEGSDSWKAVPVIIKSFDVDESRARYFLRQDDAFHWLLEEAGRENRRRFGLPDDPPPGWADGWGEAEEA